MTLEHMFMILLFVISVSALIVGSIALSKDDRDRMVFYEDKSGLNSSTSLSATSLSKTMTKADITDYYPKQDNQIVKIPQANGPCINRIHILKDQSVILNMDLALYLGKQNNDSIYLITGYYIEGFNSRPLPPYYINPVLENKSGRDEFVDIVFNTAYVTPLNKASTTGKWIEVNTFFRKRTPKSVVNSFLGTYYFGNITPKIEKLENKKTPLNPTEPVEFYTGANLSFS